MRFCASFVPYVTVGYSNSSSHWKETNARKISKSVNPPRLHDVALRSFVDVQNLTWPIGVLKDPKYKLLKE